MSEKSEEITNRVAQSALLTIDLEDYYPVGQRILLDISMWLHEGIILREKEFRAALHGHSWAQYDRTFVALTCSTEAIIPGWAYMLVATKLQPFASHVVIGDLELLETCIFQEVIHSIDLEMFRDKPVIIKGCSKRPIPENAYVWLTAKIQPIAKSVMYGEACSSVPLFKKRK
ncbi:DUF2480 family protein [Arenibacter sp. GZD96]|uniref:DUF2480 family protein n=1 Tax=Aurantibrevibacter litoralis TaxID=3106030 RepID=UPI002AFFF1A5|nr:DUF2480 family protein [Arenibacter sp. GZD-96]MEA1787510.1 DUF2480 family protein [Arenibacter sp. GZD-96]